MAFRNPEEVEAFTEWAQNHIANMGRYVHTNGLLTGELRGHCVWAMPGRIFIGKIWPADDRTKALWVISGEIVTSDHIAANLADTARDAARHFALKWQLQADRFASGLGVTDEDAGPEADSWREVGEQMAARAEALYAVAEKDELWDTEKQAVDKLLPAEYRVEGGDREFDA